MYIYVVIIAIVVYAVSFQGLIAAKWWQYPTANTSIRCNRCSSTFDNCCHLDTSQHIRQYYWQPLIILLSFAIKHIPASVYTDESFLETKYQLLADSMPVLNSVIHLTECRFLQVYCTKAVVQSTFVIW